MKKILIIDIETTGWLNAGGKIVEVGIVELDLVSGSTKVLFDEVCQEPGMTPPDIEKSWIVANSTLTVAEVIKSHELDLFKPLIQKTIDKYPLGTTAFNNKFDFEFLESRGFEFPKKLGCPMLLLTPICQLPGKYGYKWPSCQEAYDYLFKSVAPVYIEAHRGADDALHEAEIVYELYLRGVFKI